MHAIAQPHYPHPGLPPERGKEQFAAQDNLQLNIDLLRRHYMQTHDKLYLNGQWTAPSGRNTFDDINASTREVMATIPDGDENDANAAVAAARAAFDAWSTTSPADRAGFLRKIQEGLKARAEELAHTI